MNKNRGRENVLLFFFGGGGQGLSHFLLFFSSRVDINVGYTVRKYFWGNSCFLNNVRHLAKICFG